MKRLTLASRIRKMKIGEVWTLDTPGERAKVLAISKNLRDAGVIDFQITTKPLPKGGFVAIAMP